MTIDEYRAMRDEIMGRRKAAVECYEATFDKRPEDALDLLEERIGRDGARLAVAEIVRLVGDWDGRVWPDTRRWADSVPGGLTREEMNQMGIHVPDGRIHPAHINQLAQEYVHGSRSESRRAATA